MRYFILILLLVSCGKKDDPAPTPTNMQSTRPKLIFSKWVTPNSTTVDFSKGKYGVSFSSTYTLSDNLLCVCATVVTGDEKNGVVKLSSCHDPLTGTNPRCSFDGIVSYSRTEGPLKVCGSTCETYN